MEYYHHRDHLGSLRLVTDEAGYQVGAHDYYPFGTEMDQSAVAADDSRMRFTGHRRDELTDTYYMLARYKPESEGFFASPDATYDVSLYRPVSWNKYPYVASNPISFRDPTGERIGLWVFFELGRSWWFSDYVLVTGGSDSLFGPTRPNYRVGNSGRGHVKDDRGGGGPVPRKKVRRSGDPCGITELEDERLAMRESAHQMLEERYGKVRGFWTPMHGILKWLTNPSHLDIAGCGDQAEAVMAGISRVRPRCWDWTMIESSAKFPLMDHARHAAVAIRLHTATEWRRGQAFIWDSYHPFSGDIKQWDWGLWTPNLFSPVPERVRCPHGEEE